MLNTEHKFSFIPNNFDLIRLFAALQIMITNHYNAYFNIGIDPLFWNAFSGVPIFLLLTGFLIPMSFEHNSNTKQFLFNRGLKIIPEMWLSIILGVLLMFASGYTIEMPLPEFILYVIGYMLYPLFTPDCLRGYGVGTINGALWIVPIQISFYLIIPILYRFLNLRKLATLKIVILLVLFVVLDIFMDLIFSQLGTATEENILYKIYNTSILIHFPMLFIGMLIYKDSDFFIKLVKNRFILFLTLHLALYYTLIYLGIEHSTLASSNSWTKYPLMLTLSLCIFSAGYSLPQLSTKILRGYDISYAIYVYHMPIANFILFSFGGGLRNAIISSIIVLLVSIFSKKYIENPFLRIKKNAMKKA